MDESDSSAVILAAGQGKRMGSEIPKPFLTVQGKPMLEHIHVSSVAALNKPPVTVISQSAQQLFDSKFKNSPSVVQSQQLGTADALLAAKNTLGDVKNIIVLYGDQPFIKSETIKKTLALHKSSGAKITFATTIVPNFVEEIYKPFWNFARIMRKNGALVIREFRDATEEEKNITEVNAGCFVFNAEWLWSNLKNITRNNAQQEYYLTDLLKIAMGEKAKIETVQIDTKEALGANSREELEILEKMGRA